MIDIRDLNWLDITKKTPATGVPYFVLPFTEKKELSDCDWEENIGIGYWSNNEFSDIEYQCIWARYYLPIPESYIKK